MNFSTYSSSNYGANKYQGAGDWSSSSTSPLFASGINHGQSVLNATSKIRMAFVRKVYSILSVQLLLTTLVSVAVMFTPSLQYFLFSNMWMVFGVLIANVATTFALLYKRNEYPTNFYLMGVFVSRLFRC